jgi:hypothetical protein
LFACSGLQISPLFFPPCSPLEAPGAIAASASDGNPIMAHVAILTNTVSGTSLSLRGGFVLPCE